jgi:hypothetical protein
VRWGRRDFDNSLACIRAERGVVRYRACAPCRLDATHAAPSVANEYAIESYRVEVRRRGKRAAQDMEEADAADLALRLTGLHSVVVAQCTHQDAQDLLAQRVMVAEPVAQAVRQCQHPLAHRQERQNVIYEVRGLLGRAPTATARGKSATLAAQAHDVVVLAVSRSQERKAMHEHSTRHSARRAPLQKLSERDYTKRGRNFEEASCEPWRRLGPRYGKGRNLS